MWGFFHCRNKKRKRTIGGAATTAIANTIAVATQDDTFPDEFDDTYDDDCGDVEEAWGKSGATRVLEMSPIKNTNGFQNGIGGEEDGLLLEEKKNERIEN